MIVEFKGQQFAVPVWTKYVCADPDGMVYAYENHPNKDASGVFQPSGGNVKSVGWLDDPDCKYVGGINAIY